VTMVPWNPVRTKVQLRLAVQRLRILQEKKEALAKKSRRDIATLLEKGKVETAKLRTETMINEDIYVELLELLELYCELLVARFGILDTNTREPDPAISEAVCSIIHSAPRTEVKELHILREMLTHKYGRDFSIAVMENRDNCVNDRVMSKLVTGTPSEQLVNAYLEEIAKAYEVDWTSEALLDNINAPDYDGDGLDGGGLKAPKADGQLEPTLPADPAIKIVSPSSKAAGKPSVPPSLPPTEDEKAPTKPVPPEDDDDVDALQRRFAALKKR